MAFVVFDPMVREIFAAPFRDRVVHHFLYNMQAEWWDRRFIYDSYSCRVGKGTLFGIKRAQHFMRVASANYTRRAYVVQLDIQGYFMSLPRRKLFERICWGLERQFEKYLDDGMGYQIYKICQYLWRMVLFDDPVVMARKRGARGNWDPAILPPRKSLFMQPPGRGIVIGNLTSQLVSNIYLDQLDRFVKFTLGYPNYGRYVDDFFIMVPEESYALLKNDIGAIERFLLDELGLKLHPYKRYYQEINKGMRFIGARIYPHSLYPSDRLQANFRRAVGEVMNGRRDAESITSYLGMMGHLDADDFVREVFDGVGW